eukprot:Tbor_TRINITY_DN5157_c4_g1::TRINITY_DN5157_c4_g1_i10::g.26148::m.26148
MGIIINNINNNYIESLDDWWFEELAGHIEKLEEQDNIINSEKAEAKEAAFNNINYNNLNNNNNIEEKRICMPSGVLLPIPPRKEEVITGDPYRDTPYHDATIITYKPEEEEQILISKKLKAMESGFINKLKNSYHFHSKLEQENAKQMRRYQGDVVQKAMGIIINNINNNYIESLDDWWFEELAGHIEKLEEQDNIINSEKAEAKEAAFNNINYNNLNNNNNNNPFPITTPTQLLYFPIFDYISISASDGSTDVSPPILIKLIIINNNNKLWK